MKFLFDFFPLIAFLVAFYFPENRAEGIYYATATIIVASLIQVCLYWLFYRRWEKMHIITLVVVLIFGSLTLWLRDEQFIKWKPTIVFWIFAAVLLGSQFIGKRNIIQRMMTMADEKIIMPAHAWTMLNLSWVIFFTVVGVLNLYVAYNYSTEFWVGFKVYGITALNLVFIVGQVFYMFRFMNHAGENTQE